LLKIVNIARLLPVEEGMLKVCKLVGAITANIKALVMWKYSLLRPPGAAVE